MQDRSYFIWSCLTFFAVWPTFLLGLLDRDLAYGEITMMQFVVLVALLGCCIEVTTAKSKVSVLFVLIVAALVGILTHAAYYNKIGIVVTGDGRLFQPAWSDAPYFSVVTFTALGYGDMAPREEYRLVAAFQAIFGYLSLGALAGMAVALFNRR